MEYDASVNWFEAFKVLIQDLTSLKEMIKSSTSYDYELIYKVFNLLFGIQNMTRFNLHIRSIPESVQIAYKTIDHTYSIFMYSDDTYAFYVANLKETKNILNSKFRG